MPARQHAAPAVCKESAAREAVSFPGKAKATRRRFYLIGHTTDGLGSALVSSVGEVVSSWVTLTDCFNETPKQNTRVRPNAVAPAVPARH